MFKQWALALFSRTCSKSPGKAARPRGSHCSSRGSGWLASVPIPALQPARWATPGEFPNSPKAQFPYLDHGKNHHLSDRALGGLHVERTEPRARHTVNNPSANTIAKTEEGPWILTTIVNPVSFFPPKAHHV